MRSPTPRAVPFLACVCAAALAWGAQDAGAATNNIATIAGTGSTTAFESGVPANATDVTVPVLARPLPDGGYLIFQQGNPSLRRVSPTGIITTIAGNGTAGYTGDGGPALAAEMNAPSGGTATPDGGYLIADANNNAIRRVAPDGTMSTAAGTGAATFGGDGGPATAAQLSFPYDVAFNPADGSYLIADADNNRIRRVAFDGTISTVAGNGGAGFGGDGGPATSASINRAAGIAFTADGGYLIADRFNYRVRKVDANGTITTVAGTGTAGYNGDGGPAMAAQLNEPVRVAVEADGGFLIADSHNHAVRRVAPDGTISTVAGTGTAGFGGDGGPATSGQLNDPIGVGVTPAGDYLIADAGNHRVRLVDAASPTPTVTGTAPASPANDNSPHILGTAPPGTTVNLYSNAACAGPPAGTIAAADFPAPGIGVTVPDNSTTAFFASATDMGGNPSPCSASSVTYVEKTPVVLPPPVIGAKVNAIPTAGKVFVKLPRTKGAKVHAAANGFVPLASIGRQIPIGSTLDTRKGAVQLTTATNRSGGTQFGNFSRGLFSVSQGKKAPLTTVSMTGAGLNACSRLPRGGAAKLVASAKRRKRTLFNNVRGHFRSRGRNSTATVRGTTWTVTDTCAGTLTKVSKGSVAVRDLTLKKTKILKAGHHYLAKAPVVKKKKHKKKH